VLYDNRATAATSSRQPDGRYAVRLTVESRKFHASRNPDNNVTGVSGEGR
jgi:hypothetical protein